MSKKSKTNISKNCSEIDFKCFIFSDDIEYIEKFFTSKNPSVSCKFINVTTELRYLRQVLLDNYKVRVSQVDILENNKVFVIAENYKKLTNIPETNTDEKDVIDKIKANLYRIGMFNITDLSIEIPNLPNKTNAKFRNKTRHLNLLKQLLPKDFGKIR